MAKFKKTAGKTSNRAAGAAQSQAEQLSKTLSESAQQIWLAGVGAFGRAQAEGHKLFEALVKEGLSLEKTARGFAGGRADFVRDAVESHVGQARERATDTWDKLEKVFEERVARALARLGVHTQSDVERLAARVDALSEAVNELIKTTGEKRRTRKAPAPKRAPRKVATKRPHKAAPRKRSATKAPAAEPEAAAAAE